MSTRHWMSILLVPAVLAGCLENPTAPADDDDHGHPGEEVTVQLTVSPDHIHIWQTEATFTVTATDQDGHAVTDFDTLQVERKVHGSDTWRAIELTREDDAYVGTYVFAESGDYDFRVAGMRPGDHDMTVLHEMSDHMQVARAHAEAAGYRVEFETDPGHIHEGDQGVAQFWVMEDEADADGNRAPITGLDATIHCLEAGGVDERHTAVEIEPGLYQAEHHFQEAGGMHAGLHFTAPDGTDVEAAIDINVAHGH